MTWEAREELRPRAFAIAYRILGSVGDAEDVVQEALMRMHRAEEKGEQIESPAAYLSTVVTRLAIDELRSARVRREHYVGEWLPEPLVTTEADDPAHHAEMADSLSLAFLVLLERLSPEQRAVFLLRDLFDYSYEQIAQIIGRSEPAVRQLAVRARRQVAEGRPRFEASPERRERLATQFFAAVEKGDLAGLESLLAADVTLHGDGGGVVPAITRPLHGRGRVARTLATWSRGAARFGGMTLRRCHVNGEPGAMAFGPDGGLFAVIALHVVDGEIHAVDAVVNPEKLDHLGMQVADTAALFRAARER
ncbi:MAG TPA: RNA polymerase sigma-70 factor [Acidimicrobiia bacterium]